MLKKILDRIRRPQNKFFEKSYSQCGEDLIIGFILKALGKANPSYIDVGANHPMTLSNTYHFYEKGSYGICIEPDSTLCGQIKSVRPKDICLNVGVGIDESGEADFYIMSAKTLNTFSKEEAERYQSYGSHQIERVEKVQLVSLNQIMAENFVPDILSLDAEGFDLQILKSIDFSRYHPLIICVETITYAEDNTEKKVREIYEVLSEHGYIAFGDTYINTIFVDESSWKTR